MSAVQAGKKKSHVGEVTKILKPFHAELTAVNKDTFTLENVIGTTRPCATLSPPPYAHVLTSHRGSPAKSDPLSGSHVID
jgi:hypothetical protein